MKAPPSRANALRRSFATVISASAAPYGYTLTVWSAGAVLIHFRHAPALWEIFLFVVGALAAFALLWLVGHAAIESAEPLEQGPARALAGALDIFAVGLAVGSATLLAMIPDWLAWPLASFSATGLYIAAASLQLAIAGRRSRPPRDGCASG